MFKNIYKSCLSTSFNVSYLFHISRTGNARYDGEKDHRRNHHPDHIDKCFTYYLGGRRESRKQVPGYYPRNNTDQYLYV